MGGKAVRVRVEGVRVCEQSRGSGPSLDDRAGRKSWKRGNGGVEGAADDERGGVREGGVRTAAVLRFL